MWLDWLIVVDDEISSSFWLDNAFNNTNIGGWRCFVAVKRAFIWQGSAKVCFLQSRGEPTL
jgi:hypothetical protein